MSLRSAVVLVALATPGVAAAQFVDRSIVVEPPAPTAGPADDGEPAPDRLGAEVEPDLDVRLTLSSLLYREFGGEAAPWIDGGAAPVDASDRRRFFADLRGELTDRALGGGAVRLDGRVRQAARGTQTGAVGGDEYELRAASWERGLGPVTARLGRQLVEALGDSKLDGASLTAALGERWRATAAAGAYPQRGSRSLATDYPMLHDADGVETGRLVPVAGGAALSYQRPAWHGDLGALAMWAPTAPADATDDGRRILVMASGYWRPGRAVDVYHHAQVEVVGPDGPHVTEATVGVDAWLTPALSLTVTGYHLDSDLYALAAAEKLADPDPAAAGQLENHTQLARVSQDAARLSLSAAAARQRWQFTVGAGLARRPALTVATTGGGSYTFPAAATGELTATALDRRAPGGLRLAASVSLHAPVASPDATRTRGLAAHLTATRTRRSHELTLDLTVYDQRDRGPGTGCTTLDPTACLGTASARGVDGGAVLAVTARRDWLVLLDGHGGVRATDSTFAMAPVAWPRALWAAGFVRLQWRYR